MKAGILIPALALLLLGGTGAAARAQGLSPFEDVPPWHWAFDAVQHLAQQGVVHGFPRNDRDLALNAVVQVFDAFVHARHPAAREWAEAFLTNLPAAWPRPLERSDLLGFTFADAQVRVAAGSLRAGRGTVTLQAQLRIRLTHIALPAGRQPPARPPIVTVSRRVAVNLVQDTAGRWRADYPSLIAVLPEVFR